MVSVVPLLDIVVAIIPFRMSLIGGAPTVYMVTFIGRGLRVQHPSPSVTFSFGDKLLLATCHNYRVIGKK